MRIEPEIGYASFSSESSYSESGDEKMTISTLQIETGLAAQRREGDFALCGGARFGIVRLGFDRGDNDNSETGYYAGPVAGAEYFFSERFTLGVEGQLVYQALDAGNDVSAISTRGLLFGRFYF